jgi:malonyl-CoA O-methyltransferase
MIDKDRVKKNFSEAKDYDNWTSYHNITLKMMSQAIKNFYYNYNKNKKRLNILDIGCGSGQGYFAVKDALPIDYFDYAGLDFAFGLLKEAKRKIRNITGLADNAYLICGDAEFLPLKDKKFDVIFSNMTLHWLNNVDYFLNKCNSALKDDGIIILSFLISGTLKEFEKNFKSAINESMKLHTFPELRYFNEKIGRAGLKINYSEIIEYIETAESSLQLLKRINMLGAKNAVNEKKLGAASLRRGLINYDKYYRNSSGMVFCTYNIAYLTLKK